MSLNTTIKQLESDLKALKHSAKAEAAFKRLSKPQKRVAIAKDVIALLEAKQLVARSLVYLRVHHNDNTARHDNFQTGLVLGQKCVVCALGGLFVCAVKFGDKVATNDVDSGVGQSAMHDYLKNLFSHEQLQLIEIAFERSWEMPGFIKTEDTPIGDWREAIRFGEKYPRNNTARMRAIMHNIIHNEGTFIP